MRTFQVMRMRTLGEVPQFAKRDLRIGRRSPLHTGAAVRDGFIERGEAAAVLVVRECLRLLRGSRDNGAAPRRRGSAESHC